MSTAAPAQAHPWRVRSLATLWMMLVCFALTGGAARASCASGIYVDGLVEFGGLARDQAAPPADGKVRALYPVCRDGGQSPDEHDSYGTVSTLKGIPASVATRDESTVYVSNAQLTVLDGHPLHREQRRPQPCTGGPDLRLHATGGYGSTELRGDGHRVIIDSDTHLTNRRVIDPLYDGQPVRTTTQHCDGGLVADRLTVIGPDLVPDRYRGDVPHGIGAGIPWAGVAITAGGLGVLAYLIVLFRVDRAVRRS